MIDPHTIPIFTDAVADPRFSIAAGIAVLAGLVRGFTGFGSALIYMPLISAVYGPHTAAPTLLLFDTLCSLPFAVHALPHANRREVMWVSIAGALAVPFGVMALLLGLPFGIALALGARWFHGTSDIFYRRLSYIIIAVSGLVSLPIFDALR